MRRLNLLTALPLVLAACDGGRGGATGGAGAGGMAVGGAAGGGASGRGGNGGSAGGAGAGGAGAGGAGAGGAGATGTAVGGAAGGGASGGGGNGGSAGGSGGSAGGAGGGSVGGAAGGGASGTSGAAGLGGAAGTQPIAGGGTIQFLTLSTNDLVVDSKRSVLYATTNIGGPDGGTVLTIDPGSAMVTGSLPVGGIAGLLAISDDGSALYVGIHTPAGPITPFPGEDGADTIRRIDLSSMTAGPAVSLGSLASNVNSKLGAGQIAAVPGSSTQYMVSRRQPGTQPDYAGLALYDGTTLLAQLDSFYGNGDSIAFVDHSTLIGCSNLQSPSELDRFSVTSTAITPGTYVRDAIDGAARTRIAVGSGWIFASDGHAVNATTLQPLGRYGGTVIAGYSVGAPVPDPDGANVWFLSSDATGMVLLDFDRTTFQPRRTISLGSLPDESNLSALVRWSPTGFAFRAYQTVYLIKLPP